MGFQFADIHHHHLHQQQKVIAEIVQRTQPKRQCFERDHLHVFLPHQKLRVNIQCRIRAAHRKRITKYDQ